MVEMVDPTAIDENEFDKQARKHLANLAKAIPTPGEKPKVSADEMIPYLAEAQSWNITATSFFFKKIIVQLHGIHEAIEGSKDEAAKAPVLKGPLGVVVNALLHCGKWGGMTVSACFIGCIWGEINGVKTISRIWS